MGAYSAVVVNSPSVSVHSLEWRFNGEGNAKMTEFQVDAAFGPSNDNDSVYEALIKPFIRLAFSQGLGTLLAYGQTGSGKTYTMTSIQDRIPEDIFACANELHALSKRAPAGADLCGSGFTISMSLLEIFGNDVFDLLNDHSPVMIMEDATRTMQFPGAKEEVAHTPEELRRLLACGRALRRTQSTAKNSQSSRSHAVCRIRIAKNNALGDSDDVLLHLVDLAGSESNSDSTHHNRDRIRESQSINKSLATLKECIRNRAQARSTPKRHVYIPYRASPLTLLLKETFGVNPERRCPAIVMANMSPNILDVQQTRNKMQYVAPLRI
ncbi:hypothetical protein HDU87_000709 [Geranomyces variabilis]|uniref:Kinesin motor domain-containing protein n=1 Tax=Geranomyces variabilis TaxID=109894 RepID=A0AAD5TQB4_9FUNG|nr:hypothetical protein HDU87_000709 [Geranomyces variabilis]